MDRRLVIGAAALAVLLIGIGAFALFQSREEPSADEVATKFVAAYGDLDADRALSYVADDADVSGLWTSVGTQDVQGMKEQFRTLIALLEAQGYKQLGTSCEELDSSAADTHVQCGFDFHDLRSDDVGRGPFSGSYLDVTVHDGSIVRASTYWEIGTFSPQMWEPFAKWVAKAHREDAEVMYTDGSYSGVRLNQESIGLWDRNTREYARVRGGSTR
jgi:hypothetical protein